MQEIRFIEKCHCGEKFTKKNVFINKFFVCYKCSSRYTLEGELLLSRHNWNVKEFYKTEDKNLE